MKNDMTIVPMFSLCHCTNDNIVPASLIKLTPGDLEDYLDMFDSETLFICMACGLFCPDSVKHKGG